MAASGNSSPRTLGFLTVIDDPEHGLFGGYLALNAAGRPLEFHCTTPVKANRAQEILYGPALAPYLHGELIGGALLGRVKTPPILVCTDQPAAVSLRATSEAPVALVLSADDGEAFADGRAKATTIIRTDRMGPATSRSRWIAFTIGPNRLAVASAQESDRRTIEETCSELLADFDLLEPFSRIREALQEARPTSNVGAAKTAKQTPAA